MEILIYFARLCAATNSYKLSDLLWLLAAIHAARDGDWTILLALVSWIGFPLVGFFLAPLVPYGTILGVVMTMLGFSVAWWLTRYH